MSGPGGGRGGRRPYDGSSSSSSSSSGQMHSFPQGGRGGAGRGRGGGGGGGGRGRGFSGSSSGNVPSGSRYSGGQPPFRSQTTGSVSAGAVFESITRDLKRLQLEPITSSAQKLLPASSKAARFAQRGENYGKAGEKCLVRANHFMVEIADKDLYHYDVSITPDVISKKLNRDIIKLLVELYKASHLGKRTPAYDGRKSLYTAGPLPFESKEFVVKIVGKEGQAGSSGASRKEREYKVTIKFASKPDLHHLRQFLQNRNVEVPQHETIQALDVALRAAPLSKGYVVVGRSFFSSAERDRGPLGDGVDYWKGFYQSLRPTQMGLSLNIDVSARSFYEPILVSDFILKHFNRRDFLRPLSEQDRLKLKKALKGVRVEPIYAERPKSYKISGISRDAINKLTFTPGDQNTQMGVVQYFRERYNINLRHTSLPALQAGSATRPVFLPMELCRILDGQRYTKRLNQRQVTALLRATCQRPAEREGAIKKMVELNEFKKDDHVKEFGMKVVEQLAQVEARILPAPMLKYHETGSESTVSPRVGQWNMINKKMVNGGKVERWACINLSENLNQNVPLAFCRELVNMCNSKGMVFNPVPAIPITHATPFQLGASLSEIHRQCDSLQLLIVIMPDYAQSYSQIKRICETELDIVSQCCKPQNVSRRNNNQYLENVALKINVKVGGRNTVLMDAVQKNIPYLTDRPTIIFGADVTHPQPGEDSSPSIAAVVASIDWPEVTKYKATVAAQAHREEIILDLFKENPENKPQGIICDFLRDFRISTGVKPERIIFYRDGVSEGEFSQVLLHEVEAIRKACLALQKDYMPRITFVVVQKRHHTRLFPVDHDNPNLVDRSGNILPGTVVDTTICHPTEFDFYLNSHAGIKGTSRPAHYRVLYDENGFTADAMQMLTYSLCFTYARCTRSVSVVPPAYYAHLAAFRARYYMDGDASEIGSTSGGSGTEGGNVEVRLLPRIKEKVRQVMFYC